MRAEALKGLIPWWGKVAAKVLLARLPVQYTFWQEIELFKHGQMERPEYAYSVFKTHFDLCKHALAPAGFTCMEIGPGDSLSSGLIARAHGATATYLIDTGPYARRDIEPYRALSGHLRKLGLPDVRVDGCVSIEEMLDESRVQYGVEGLKSLETIPSGTIDWVWSHAVLEHIRRDEFVSYMRELRRVLKPGGIASHRVDLTDHLGGALNNLRFSHCIWEEDWFAASGFYTNRIRFRKMCEAFAKAGFSVRVVRLERWEKLPTPKTRLAKEFRCLPDEELLIKGFDVLLRPIPHG